MACRLISLAELLTPGGRLVRLPGHRTTVFAGDTHGDREATREILDRFPPPEHVLVFLGDYVDRGEDSHGNLELLLQAKLTHPAAVHLLMGNHEGWAVSPFSPADFWQGLSPSEEEKLGKTLATLPYVAHHPAGILALHGALPDVGDVAEIARVPLGSVGWRAITWGDWVDAPGYALGSAHGRPAFGADYFARIAARLGIAALVRSHQPSAPMFLYGGRCLTLFTSRAYEGTVRRVAILHPGRPVRTARDLDLADI